MYLWTSLILSLLCCKLASCGINDASQVISRSGFVGCRFSQVCTADELCVDDNLFGSCQKLFADRLERDIFRYQLRPQQLQQLHHLLNGLARAGYTWRHLYTQCVLTRALLEFRHNVRVGENFCKAAAALSAPSSTGISQHSGNSATRGNADRNMARTTNEFSDASGSSGRTADGGQFFKRGGSSVRIEDLLSGDLYDSLVELIRSKVSDKENKSLAVSAATPTDTVSQSLIGWQREQDEVDTFLSSLSRDDLLALKLFLISEAKRINESSFGGAQSRRRHGWVPPVVRNVESVKQDDQDIPESVPDEIYHTTDVILDSVTGRKSDGRGIEDEDGIERKLVDGESVVESSSTTLASVVEHSHHSHAELSKSAKVRRSSFIAVYVLLCVLCVLSAAALVLLYHHNCSASNKSLKQHLADWTGSLAGSVSGTGVKGRGSTKYTSGHDEYQDLCRQRMLDAQSEYEDDEKEEELSRGDTPSVVAATRTPVVGRSSSYCIGGSSKRKNGPVAAWVASAGRSLSYAQTRDEDEDDGMDVELDVTTGHLILSYMEDLAVNQDRLCREWHALCEADDSSGAESSTSVALEAENVRKNRTASVLPYEETRVRLDARANLAKSDYINASHLSDHDPRNAVYIATQGPLSGTVDDFWQMIWEQNSVVIVNLTTLASSSGTVHSHRYWPRAESDRYHIYEVMLMSEHSSLDKTYIVRNFSLRNVTVNQVRTVTQFQYLAWPEHGIPASIESLLHFRAKVNKSYRGQSSPIVVQCSDGAGRTGTYCLIDLVLNRIAKGVKEIDLAATLEHLREQRMNLVHSQEQFEFAVGVVIAEVQRLLRVNHHNTY